MGFVRISRPALWWFLGQALVPALRALPDKGRYPMAGLHWVFVLPHDFQSPAGLP
jgi:hypothetical protein